MKIVSLLFIFLSSLFANEALDSYRINGIENIQKKLDFELTKNEYWSKYISDKDTTFGYFESISNILRCNVSSGSIYLYSKDKKRYSLNKNYRVFTGEIKGDKEIEGDLKTPLGVYTFNKKIEKLDSFYGPLAFVTSYPNIYDKYRKKSGSGIWIHGLPIDEKRNSYTKGCIALENSDIVALDKRINIDDTLLIIENKVNNYSISKPMVAKILSQLFEWRYAWIYNDYDKYISFYSPDFVRYDKMSFDYFKRYKNRIFNKSERKNIIFKNINIIKYPNSENIYQISFYEEYQSQSFTFEGDKILMVKVDNSFKIGIFTEK